MNCQNFQAAMPEFLLHPAAAPAAAHLETCSACQKEFAAFQATFSLLDTWKAPEPSPYFDQKLAVLLREEQARPPASWLERLKSRLLFNTGRQFRPALAGGTMALALLIGGGTFASISRLPTEQHAIQVSAAVGDLQILDKNVQALQQMDQLLQEAQPADDATAPPPIS